jgi:uncharacterized membrane protein
MSVPTATRPPRLLALDWLRGFAVLVMAECHVFNALLAPEYRGSAWFSVLNWMNGLVAPAFLLVSGGVMGMNLNNRWQDVIARGAAWRKMWRRVGQVFVVAYLLHLPTPLLWQFFGPRGPHLLDLWTKMDILQCIFGSLSLILLLVPLTRRPDIHRIVCAVLGVMAATSTRWVDAWAAGVHAPKWLMNYLWPTGVGRFPLVPWAAFLLFGVWLGPAIFSEESVWRQTMRALLAGAAFILAAELMKSPERYDTPFVLSRMGWVLVGLAGCCWLGAPKRGMEWILQFGQLSLWSYTVHLIIVYGSGISLGLDTLLPLIKKWSASWLNMPPPSPGFTPATTIFWLACVLYVTARVVKQRAKILQRQKTVRIMPAK